MVLGDILRSNVKRNPDKTALVYGNERYSYRQLSDRVNRLSNAFRKMGLRKGDRLCFMSHNCPEFVETLFAAAKCGIVFVPISFRFLGPEILYILNNADAKALVISTEYQERRNLIDLMKGVKFCISIHGKVGSMIDYNYLVGSHVPVESEVEIDESDHLMVLYTSGSTGKPKGVIINHRLGCRSGINIAMALGLTENDIALIAAPLHHTAAIWRLFCHFYIRGSVVILPRFDAVEVLKSIQQEKVTTISLSPTTIRMLMEALDAKEYDISTLRIITSGAAPLPSVMFKMARQVFGDIIMNVYGLTEAPGGFLTYMEAKEYTAESEPAKIERLAKSIGREALNVELRVVNGEGIDVMPGEVGEIVVRMDNDIVMEGYWNLPEETDKAIKNGWLFTGDLATIDEDGYISISDRKSFMIISGGENIYPREIEEVLYQHPAIKEACVIGLKDERWGEAVKAVVVLDERCHETEDGVIKFCKQHIAGYKAPKSVDFVSELPKDPVGKILRNEVRQTVVEKQ